jgi:hypothetical protein
MNKNKDTLSKLVITYSDGSTSTSLLEPLVGILRDPRYVCHKFSSTLGTQWIPLRVTDNKNVFFPYFLLDPTDLKIAQQAPQVFFFDIGASTFSDSSMVPLSMFVDLLNNFNVELSHIFSWEAKPASPEYWEGMPLHLLGRTSFYNTYASSDVSSKWNPLNLLQSVATVNDFVFFKLDIDTPSVEMPLIEQILNNTSFSNLIDIFFFEHHVDIPEMRRFWGEDLQMTLHDSYEIFTQLRRKGIRAHSYP